MSEWFDTRKESFIIYKEKINVSKSNIRKKFELSIKEWDGMLWNKWRKWIVLNTYRYTRKMNYYETDRMGIIHHSNYIRYFEEARLNWMEHVGVNYRQLEELGVMIPVMFVDCKYLLPLQFGDEIEIEVKLAKFDGIKMEFSYEIKQKGTGECCTTGRTGHCFLNDQMKPFRLKRQFPELYQKMQEALERDGGVGRKDNSL